MAVNAQLQAPLIGGTSGPLSDEERISLARQHYEAYASQPDNIEPFVARETKTGQDRIWNRWTRYCEDVGTDSHSTWLDFVRHPDRRPNQAHFVSFLKVYTQSSLQKRLVLGPQEHEWKQTMTSAFSLTEIWRRLVAAADNYVLEPQRKANPSERGFWALRWMSKEEGAREGPTYLIVKLIFVEIAVELKLDTDPSYVKVAMTSTDVNVFLKTLWTRADIIRCKPDTRVSFHSMILLAAIGGFRPGTLLRLTFSQFKVAVVRDPDNHARTKIVMTVFIERNKIKQTAKTSRARHGGSIGFSITLVPNSTFCLGSLILARGIQRNAFKADYTTIDDILDLPRLGSVNYIPLDWKEEMLKKEIFSLSYKTVNDLWHRTLLVAGARKDARLYSLRLGAGANIDGVLSDAMRNYVLSHSTAVFESSYQPAVSRAQLMKLAFGPSAGNHEQLFSRLSDMSLSWDPNAPVEISTDEKQAFENRSDISNIRKAIAAAEDSKVKSNLRNKLTNHLKNLGQLQLEDNRFRYFEHADLARARGQDITNNLSPLHGTDNSPPAIAQVCQLLQTPFQQHIAGFEAHSRRFMSAVLAHLHHMQITDVVHQEEAVSLDESKIEQILSRCLLCNQSFSQRSALTRHFTAKHTKGTTFRQPICCPVCQVRIEDPMQWCNHVESKHGKEHAPNWKHETSAESCCLCLSSFDNKPRLITHMKRHVQVNASEWPHECRLCTDVLLHDMLDWLQHAKTCHLLPITVCVLCGHIGSSTSGLTRHLSDDSHAKTFEEPFPCPLCVRQGMPVCVIEGLASWYMHTSMAHAEWIDIYHMPKNAEEEGSSVGDENQELSQYDIDMGDVLSTAGTLKRPMMDIDLPEDENVNDGESSDFQYSWPLSDGSMCDSVVPPISEQFIDPELLRLELPPTPPASIPDACSLVAPREITPVDAADNSGSIPEPPSYAVDCILERWKKNLFLIKWSEDGSISWVSRDDILDEELVKDFEAAYPGYQRGVEKCRAGKHNGRTRYRIYWRGRPDSEAVWVDQKDLSPALLHSLQPCRQRPRKRRRH